MLPSNALRRILFGALPVIAVLLPIVPAWTQVRAAEQAAVTNPALVRVLAAQTVEIDEGWQGLSALNPVDVHIRLKNDRGAFRGDVEYAVSHARRKATAQVNIPASAAMRFLRMLAQSPLRKGPYVPRMEHTDDYPSVSIRLHAGRDTIEFFSRSQGKTNVPWAAKVGGETYVVASPGEKEGFGSGADLPARALDSLDPYLQRDVQRKLMNGGAA